MPRILARFRNFFSTFVLLCFGSHSHHKVHMGLKRHHVDKIVLLKFKTAGNMSS